MDAFNFSHSDIVWMDAEKNDEKITPYCHPLYVKTQICIVIAKIEKLKTWPLSEFIL